MGHRSFFFSFWFLLGVFFTWRHGKHFTNANMLETFFLWQSPLECRADTSVLQPKPNSPEDILSHRLTDNYAVTHSLSESHPITHSYDPFTPYCNTHFLSPFLCRGWPQAVTWPKRLTWWNLPYNSEEVCSRIPTSIHFQPVHLYNHHGHHSKRVINNGGLENNRIPTPPKKLQACYFGLLEIHLILFQNNSKYLRILKSTPLQQTTLWMALSSWTSTTQEVHDMVQLSTRTSLTI